MHTSEHEMRVLLQVPYSGKEGDAVNVAIAELDKYVKARYPKIQNVRIAYRNPHPELGAALHDAWIVVVVFNPFTKRLSEHIADDVFEWMKKRWKKVKRGHKRSRKPPRRFRR